MSSVRSEAETTGPHAENIREQAEHLLQDFSEEVKHEINEIRHHESLEHANQADLFVRRHVMGLILILFGIVALLLLIGISVMAFYGHHPSHAPGMFLGSKFNQLLPATLRHLRQINWNTLPSSLSA